MTPKKLIEVALPLEAINVASAHEKQPGIGAHPRGLHLWWARRPLAAARAVIFAQMVDDPSAHPDIFPTEKKQEKERQRLFRIIEELVKWENTTNEAVLQQARDEIWQSWRYTCAENADHPRAKELFDRYKLPAFHDPFAGGGALPLEAQRLGLESYASDLNPVAVLINKAMIEIPPKFAGKPPVNPESRKEWIGNSDALPGIDGLAESDGRGQGSVSTGSAPATRGDLRDALTDHPRGGIGAGEHRGGMDARIGQGESAVSGDRSGIACRDGNLPDTLRGDRLVSENGNGKPAGITERSRKNADDTKAKVQELGTSGLGNSRKEAIPGSYSLFPTSYRGAEGLAADVRYYGQWMRDEAEKRIGHLYPKIEVTAEMAESASNPRPDLKNYVGRQLTVIAWLWARTVKSPNPAFATVDVPLASTFMLSTKAGKEAYVEAEIENRVQEIGISGRSNSYLLSPNSYPSYRFTVKVGKPKDAEGAKNGTKLSRGANFKCLMSETPIASAHIYDEANAGRMGARLMAIVAEGDRGRVYLAPTPEMEAIALTAQPEWKPEVAMPENPRWFSPPLYGLKTYGDLFTPRQLVALTTFSDLVQEARERVKADAIAAGLPDDGLALAKAGAGATAYADAVGVYLAFAIDRLADYNSSVATWKPSGEQVMQTYKRQALPMTWDFPESNVLGQSAICWKNAVKYAADNLLATASQRIATSGFANQQDAATQSTSIGKVVSTDPPYYDNIGYADLSDFFYVWLRRALKPVFPDLFATLAVPKDEELVATPYRHGSKEKAEIFFLDGMTQAMHRLGEQAHPAFPVTIYYAFKQAESDGGDGTTNTGWDTFLAAVIEAGFAISGTWPMRTELSNRMIGSGTNALASSIVLVCRQRPANAPTATRREFVAALKAELPAALRLLQGLPARSLSPNSYLLSSTTGIAPVDLAQAAIGPGMAVYTRYARVLDAEGQPLSVRAALALINQTLDEALAEQEGDFDADTRWALTWFEQVGFAEGDYGVAEQLSKSKNTAVDGLVEAGIIVSKAGKVRLLKPAELPADWNPATDSRLTVWEMVHQLIRVLEAGGEGAAAALVAKLGSSAETARELCYRLYTLCERKKRAADALAYNALVQSWPEIVRLAREAPRAATPGTDDLFE